MRNTQNQSSFTLSRTKSIAGHAWSLEQKIQIGKCLPNGWVLKKMVRKPLFLFPFENFIILLKIIVSSIRVDFLLYSLSCSLYHHLFRSRWQSGYLCSVMPISQLTRLPPRPTELFLDHDTELRGCPHGFCWWTKLFPECGSQKMTVWILSLAAVV